MLPTVAVIIPSLNESTTITTAIQSSAEAGATEIVVADAGSEDGTTECAGRAGARVLIAEGTRGRRLNRAAEASQADILIFLHADSVLPPDAIAAVRDALGQGFVFGGFRIAFLENARRLRIAASLINLRTGITRCPWGDQAQFIRRDQFLAVGGFRDMPIMEDYELALRMKRLGRTVVLPQTARTSGRRFLTKGVLATAAINWRMIAAYHLGADPQKLADLYRGPSIIATSTGATGGVYADLKQRSE